MVTAIDGQLPPALRQAINRLTDGIPTSVLRQASVQLTNAYRRNGGRVPAMMTTVDRLAYVAARLPATFESTRAVLNELRRRNPDLKVNSLLELGAGPAPGLLAAHTVFPELSRATHLESDPEIAGLGRRLLTLAGLDVQVKSLWVEGSAAESKKLDRHDLVLLAYVVGELPDDRRQRVIAASWQAADAALVIVEPGTPAGATRVLDARAWLIEHGAHIAAPCPHAAACPLPAEDWCHFGARFNRSSLQRRLKSGTLSYEDEKYAYVAMTRSDSERCDARVLRRPTLAPRRVILHLCTANGLRTEQLTRGRSTQYRTARKARWGDTWATRAVNEGPSRS